MFHCWIIDWNWSRYKGVRYRQLEWCLSYSGCEISLIWMPPALCIQNVAFTEEDGDAMSFDECMQLLAETFPLVEPAAVREDCIFLLPHMLTIRPCYHSESLYNSMSKWMCYECLWFFSLQAAPPCLDPSIPPCTDSTHLMMPGEIPMLTQNPLLPGPMDQTWMDLQVRLRTHIHFYGKFSETEGKKSPYRQY